MQRSDRLYPWLVSAALAALIAVTTAYLFHLPVGANGGYVHFGDALIFLAAGLLPLPCALTAAAVGAGLADLLTAPVWLIPTVLLKSVTVLCFTSRNEKILCARNIGALLPAAVLTVAGYYAAEALLFGNWAAPLAGLPGNLLQCAGSSAVFLLLGRSLDRLQIKRRWF